MKNIIDYLTIKSTINELVKTKNNALVDKLLDTLNNNKIPKPEKHNRKEDIELNVSESGWDSEMVAYPHVVKEDNRLIMFYNGNKFGNTGIGYAIKEL